ncbi:unnamed protein product [Cuscuta europaea]|uniref:Uncharacterized protein n=1 Tax=Cuscuta europaea TaxID=41803 RepID=A0A9P0VW65_CUSEU|nr:unnamed protein product [Cuscuta europaea]
MIVNVTGASCKRRDRLRQIEHERLLESLESGEIVSGKGKNQEVSLKRPGDTRWGSHYITIIRLMSMWSSVLKALENVYEDGANEERGIASSLIDKMENCEFVFVMHLMIYLLGITNELSLALQQKDQNIVLAIHLISTMKAQLQEFRDNGWDNLFKEVNLFCENQKIPLSNMEEHVKVRGRSRRNGETISNLIHFRGGIFCEGVIGS